MSHSNHPINIEPYNYHWVVTNKKAGYMVQQKTKKLMIFKIYTFGIHKKQPSTRELATFSPSAKASTLQKKRMSMGKEKDQGKYFNRTKMKMELVRNGCSSHCGVY